MNILVLESDPYTQKALQLILNREGYTLLFSPTIDAVLLTAIKLIPDLLLLDITLPDLDIFEFLEALRAAPETETIPVIVFIDKSQAVKKEKYLLAGASACLKKPFRPHHLLAHIEALKL